MSIFDQTPVLTTKSKKPPPPPPPLVRQPRVTAPPPLTPKQQKALAKAAEKERLAREKEEAKQRKAREKAAEKERLAKQKAANKRQKALYQGAGSGTTDVGDIAGRFQATMLKEKAAREDYERQHAATILEGRKKGFSPTRARQAADDQLGDIETIAERIWDGEGLDVRAMRPLRFDPFDRRLRDIEAAKTDAMALQHGLVSEHMKQDEATGGLMTVDKATKKVLEHREEARLAKRMDKTATPEEDPEASWERAVTAKREKDTALAKQEHLDTGGGSYGVLDDIGYGLGVKKHKTGEVDLPEHQVEAIDDKSKKALEDERDKDVGSLGQGLGLGGTIGGLAGTATKAGAKKFGDNAGETATENQSGTGLVYTPHVTSVQASTDEAIVSGFSMQWLGDLLNIIGGLIGFVQQIQKAKQYGATGQEKIEMAKNAMNQLNALTTTARDACTGAAFIIERFQDHASALTDAAVLGAETLPGIGLAISALSLIAATIGVLPSVDRLAAQTVATEIQENAPKPDVVNLLAMTRLKKSMVVQIEQAFFSMAKNSTMIGLHIAEIASAGGFGIPMAAKLTVSLVGLLHSAAHKARELIEEQLSAKAKARYFGAHEEGAARGMVERDPGTAADVVIHSAQTMKDYGSRIIISSYDIPEDEIDHMLHHEIRVKMLKGMKEEGEPRTIEQKWEDLKKSAVQFVEGDESTGEQSLRQAMTPKTPEEKARDAKDLEVLVAAKNASMYKGTAGRTVGISDSLRSADKIDKSFLKVRQHMLRKDPTLTADQLPWSRRDDEIRARRQRLKDEMQISPHIRRNAEVATSVGVNNMILQARRAEPGPDIALELAYLERVKVEKKKAEDARDELEQAKLAEKVKKTKVKK